ncbi:MAG: DNA repair protein RecO [Lachnospiraceae bacterium]|nr:DNA repair protein RecO [Lachnospiraceae bacterium]
MQDFIMVTGMVIKTIPVGEYDKSVTILTREKGKLSAFARGARRQNGSFSAVANPFTFATFKLFPGRSSYSISDAEVINYFEGLRSDYEGAYYGLYFLEIADYYARENDDDAELLKLCYQSLRALMHENFPNRLVRAVFEIKAMSIAGEFAESLMTGISEDTAYAVSFIVRTPPEKLYTFKVTEEVLAELSEAADRVRRRVIDRPLKSLDVLDKLC